MAEDDWDAIDLLEMHYQTLMMRCHTQITYSETKTADARFYTYVLLLQNGKIYVGSTDNIYTRLYDHFSGSESSAVWVKEHGPPIRVMEIIQYSHPDDEKYKFSEYADKFGYENVRGGPFCRLILQEPPTCVIKFVHTTRPFNYIPRDQINIIVSRVNFLIQKTFKACSRATLTEES